jgi:hypothetical protein
MQTISNEIKQFVTEEPTFPRGRWFTLNGDVGHVYLRRETKWVEGSRKSFITIANITIERKYRGKRLFSSFVQELQELIKSTNYNGLYAECVYNQVLQDYFVRHGWKPDHKYYDEINVVEPNYWISNSPITTEKEKTSTNSDPHTSSCSQTDRFE